MPRVRKRIKAVILSAALLSLASPTLSNHIDWEIVCDFSDLPYFECDEQVPVNCWADTKVVATRDDLCVPTDACVFDVTSEGIHLYDAMLQIDDQWTDISFQIEIEIDIVAGALPGCTRAYLHPGFGSTFILDLTSNQLVDEPETLRLISPWFQNEYELLVSSPDVEILEVRVFYMNSTAGSSWSTLKATY